MPTYEVQEADLVEGAIDILSLLHVSGLVPSKSEARRAVTQGGVTVDGEKVTDIKTVYTKEQLAGDGIVLKRGKKNFRKITM
jgi:tyrosyl-tRNA synthetase